MNIHGTDNGYKVVFGKDYDSMREDTSEVLPISIVVGFIIFLLVI